MRDIRDESSPYRDRYTEFDYWCYANAVDIQELGSEKLREDAQQGAKEWVNALVDDQGFIVPQLEYQKQQYAGYYSDAAEAEEDPGCDKSFTVLGVMSDELRGQYLGVQAGALARAVAPVPEWVAKAPPVTTVVLENGEVLAQGELGAGAGDFSTMGWLRDDEPMAWHRYSAEGELLETGRPGDDWQALYMDNYAELRDRAEADDNVSFYCMGRHCVLYDFSSNDGDYTAEIYNLAGERLDIAIEDFEWGNVDEIPLAGGMLQLVYACQQQMQ